MPGISTAVKLDLVSKVVNFIDYTASRVLARRDLLRQVPSQDVAVSLILTLADDNVGVLPQLATGSFHQLLGDLRDSGWAGFYTRYWTVGEQDPTIHYLARASWDASLTPIEAYTDQVESVCGVDERILLAVRAARYVTSGMSYASDAAATGFRDTKFKLTLIGHSSLLLRNRWT